MTRKPIRVGDKMLPFDPAELAGDARLVFIGRIRSPWETSSLCPKNLREARARDGEAWAEVDPDYRDALAGIDQYSHVLLLYWLDQARRDLVIHKTHRADAPLATFATRSPVRPNPIGMAAVRLTGCDLEAGRLGVDAIDCIDGTPLLDIKPYLPDIDSLPGTTVAWIDTTGEPE